MRDTGIPVRAMLGHWRVSRQLVKATIICSVATACTQVESQVEVFHELPISYPGESIAILSGDENKAGTLEFKDYAARLRAKLTEVGFNVVDGNSRPKYVAFLGYAVGPGEQVTSSYSIPNYGVTGYSSSYTQGTLNSFGGIGTYSGTTTYTPQYGITGYSTGITTSTYFPRVVVVDIYEVDWSNVKDARQVYQLSISSSGTCGVLSQVIDEMLEAGFQNFPGENASAKRIQISSDAEC